MKLFEKFQQGLPYEAFLARYANENQKERWRQLHAQVSLTGPQRELLGSFRRKMNILCLATNQSRLPGGFPTPGPHGKAGQPGQLAHRKT